MNFKKIYPKLPKVCFFTLLLLVVITISTPIILPNYEEASSRINQCYWNTDLWSYYIKCQENVPFGNVIEPTLNYSYRLSIVLIIPVFFFIYFPPTLWIPLISLYFFALSYPILKIRRRFWGEPTQERPSKFFSIAKWLLILSLASIFIHVIIIIIKNILSYL